MIERNAFEFDNLIKSHPEHSYILDACNKSSHKNYIFLFFLRKAWKDDVNSCVLCMNVQSEANEKRIPFVRTWSLSNSMRFIHLILFGIFESLGCHCTRSYLLFNLKSSLVCVSHSHTHVRIVECAIDWMERKILFIKIVYSAVRVGAFEWQNSILCMYEIQFKTLN